MDEDLKSYLDMLQSIYLDNELLPFLYILNQEASLGFNSADISMNDPRLSLPKNDKVMRQKKISGDVLHNMFLKKRKIAEKLGLLGFVVTINKNYDPDNNKVFMTISWSNSPYFTLARKLNTLSMKHHNEIGYDELDSKK